MKVDQIGFVIAAMILAGLRIGGVKHEAFQAVAHFFTAWVFAAWWYRQGRFYRWVGITLSVIETACAIYGIIAKR